MLIFSFTGTQVLAVASLALLALIGGILLLRFRLRRARPSANDHRTKLAGADPFRQRPLFLKVGFVVALGSSFLAINWTVFDVRPNFSLGSITFEADLEQVPPRTMEKPHPPLPPPPVVEPIPEEEVTESVTFESNDISATESVVPPQPKAPVIAPDPVMVAPPPRKVPDEIFKVVEEMPIFGEDCLNISDRDARRQCSDRAILSYFGKHLVYPPLARENGIEGAVVLRFVVEKDGSIGSLEILRDPGAGLGGEALRVLEEMGETYRWSPGKQRGRPVRVYFNLPIRFRLE